ncbi:MAG: glycosyltransferase [Bacteroidia bacterium]|nr:glycosyltransferase [Bacteroidia bacterium]
MFYIIFIKTLHNEWCKIPENKPDIINNSYSATLIIACRNEENTIETCLNCILNDVDLSGITLEIIVVNDHSTDRTREVIKKIISLNSNQSVVIKMIELTDKSGKKSAIEAGIVKASYSTIITTDADCTFNKGWLKMMLEVFNSRKLKMLCGPVKLEGVGAFAGFQSVESAGLVVMGAATMHSKIPTTCNGANLMYSKEAFYECKGFSDNAMLASGDDEFLMHKMFSAFPGQVEFSKFEEAIVFTATENSFSGFLNQRSRWASKSSFYKDKRVRILQMITALFILSVFVNLILWFALQDENCMLLFLLMLVGKISVDLSYFRSFNNFFKLNNFIWLVPMMFIYQLYFIPVLLKSFGGSYNWKGRTTV